jgi:hypothetical protein
MSEGFDLNAYLLNPDNLKAGWTERMLLDGFRQVKPICCADGLSLSVQASVTHYCYPRNGIGPWTTVEIGFPSACVEELMEYADDPDYPTGTVYGWVPVEVVEAVINNHSGIVPCPESASDTK